MKVLLDEQLPHVLRHAIVGHEVVTAKFANLLSVQNGELLARAADLKFDVLVTADRGMQYEQHLATLPLSIAILRAKPLSIYTLRPLVPRLLETLETLRPRTLVQIGGDLT